MVLLLVAIGLGLFLRATGSEWRNAVPERVQKANERFEREGRSFESDSAREKALFKSAKLEHYVQTGLYIAASGNLVLAMMLFFTRRWWIGSGVKVPPADERPAGGGSRFWLFVGAAVLLALVLRAPRMDLSLYNDEAYSYRHYIHGQHKTDADGSSEYEEVSWMQTLWHNKASNGVLFSALAKLSDGAWRALRGTPRDEINETALRLPALIPGLLSILVIALSGRLLFGSLAGGAAAFWLALHPWHIRYCTEARAYGLAMLFAALMMLCLIHALRNNRWRWWFGFGAAQFALMWAYAGALYFAAAINLAVFVFVWRRGNGWGPAAGGRLVVASVLSAMLYLQVMFPCFPEMILALETVASLKGSISAPLLTDMASYLGTGMPAFDRDPTNSFNPAIGKFWPGYWWLLIPSLLALLGLAALALTAFRRSAIPGLLAAGNLLALVFAVGGSAWSGGALYAWYIIYVLPFVGLFMATGWAVLWKTRRLRFAAVLLPALVLLTVQKPIRDYRGHGKESLREIAAEAARDGALVAWFWTDAAIYDPQMRRLKSPDDLQSIVAEAEREGRALSVVFAHRSKAMSEFAEVVHLLEDEAGDFKLVGRFPGLERADYTARVYRSEP